MGIENMDWIKPGVTAVDGIAKGAEAAAEGVGKGVDAIGNGLGSAADAIAKGARIEAIVGVKKKSEKKKD